MENKIEPLIRSNRNISLIEAISNRFMLTLTLYYCMGIVFAYLYSVRFTAILWPVLAVLILSLLAYYCRVFPLDKAVLLLLTLAAGAAAFYYAFLPSNQSIINFAGSPLYLEGTIIEEPVYHEKYSTYNLKIEMIETGGEIYLIDGVVQVRVYGDREERYWYGERLGIRGTIVEPRGMRNPGGFDYQFFLRSQGIDALIYTDESRISFQGVGSTNIIAASSIRLRCNLVEQITTTLPTPSAELLTAILFGQRHYLPPEVEENFRRAGAGHLMAVSGLHVGLVAALVLGLWSRMNLRGRLPLVLAIILVFAYAYLTGFRPSALRAAIMVSLALGAILLDRENDLPTAVSFAALITLFINPLLLFTIGFQLSYAATLLIIYGHKPIEGLLNRIYVLPILKGPIAVTIAAQLGVLPLCLYYFHHLPLGALMFNIILLPLIAFIVGLGLAGAATGMIFAALGEIMLWAVYPLLEAMIFITALASQDFLYQAVLPPGIIMLICYYLSLFLVLRAYYQGCYNREFLIENLTKRLNSPRAGIISLITRARPATLVIAGLTLVTIIFWVSILYPGQKDLRVTFIDVGQGAAALIEAPCGMAIMVDAGGRPAYLGCPGEVGEKVVLPLLRRQGIKRLDLAVITHPHEDHYGGFIPIVESMPIDTVFVSQLDGGAEYYTALIENIFSNGTQVYEVKAGQTWLCCDKLMLEVVHPGEKLLTGTPSDLNNNSIVFKMNYKAVSLLFTGDIEEVGVNYLFRSDQCLEADLLLIPHHGGYMESIPQFLEAVSPQVAIIQVGINSFGHPHPYVIKALDDKDIPVYRNDQHGAVIVETNGSDFRITTMEQPELQFN